MQSYLHTNLEKQSNLFIFDPLDSISRLTSLCIHDEPNSIRYTSTTIYYPSCQQISDCYNVRVQSYSHANSEKQSNLFILDILDSISRLTSLCINNGQNSIRYTSTTIYYPSCQQISDCYNVRVQSYSHANSEKRSNLFIFDLLDSISRLTSLFIHDEPNSIRYTSTTIYYPSCQQISDCYNVRVQSYSHANSEKQSNLFIFDLLDSISRLTSLFIHDEPNSIRYTSTTIYYPSC